MGTVSRIDRRTVEVHVPRGSLSRAAENALAGSRMAQDAIERATDHIVAGDDAAALHELGRIGFELQGRTKALMALTRLAEQATACPESAAAAA